MKRILALGVSVIMSLSMALSMTGCGVKTTSIYENVDDVERAANGLTWPEGQSMPSFAYPAETVEAVDISGVSADVKRMLVSLQGIVNRTQPRIALCDGNERSGDGKWLTDEGVNYEFVEDYNALILKYKDELQGLVIWDNRQKDTVNLAHTYAGIHDALAVSPKLAEIYQAEPYNLTVLEDYQGDFSTKLEVYNYMYDNLWQDCTHRLLMGLGPDLTLTGSRDLAIAAKCAITYTDLSNAEEVAVMEKFLGDMRPGEDYFSGWFVNGDEGGGIGLNSKYGIATVPSDYYNNYSIHASLSRELDMPTVTEKPKLENKYYIAFVVSDGDNLQYVQGSMKGKWNTKYRGEYPISWTIATSLLDAGPQMLNYYYNTATEQDCFVSGPSGAGYINIEKFKELYGAVTANDETLVTYATRADTYFRKTGIRFVTAWYSILNSQAQVYGENAPAMLGISRTHNLDNQNQSGNSMAGNTPFFITSPWYDGDLPRVQKILDGDLLNYSGRKPEFRLAQIVGWDMNVKTVNEMCAELKEKYGDLVEFVRADHLAMLYAEYNGGTYNVALRADVTASGSDNGETVDEKEVSYDASQIVDGSTAKYKGWKYSGEEQWITVDLGETYEIDRYYLSLAGTGYYSKDCNLKAFQVQVSMDGEKWSTIDTVKNNTDNILDKTFEATEARYVKIAITDAGSDGIARIQELEIHGKKPGAEAPQ